MKICDWCGENIIDKRRTIQIKHECPEIFIHRILNNKYKNKNNTTIMIRGSNLALRWIESQILILKEKT